MNAMSRFSNNKTYQIIKLVVAMGIIIFLIDYVEPRQLLTGIKEANITFFTIAFFLVIPNILFQYLKWALICRQLLHVDDRKTIFRSLFYGISAGSITPLKLGELFARAVPFKENRFGKVIMASAIDKLFPMILIFLFGIISITIFIITNQYPKVFINQYYGVPIVLVIVFIIIIMFSSRSMRTYIVKQLKKIPIFKLFIEDMSIFRKINFKLIIRISALSLLFHLTFTTQMSFLLCAFSGVYNFPLYFLIANLIVFTHVILSPLGLGEIAIREGTAVFYIQAYGMSGAIGFNAALFLTLINIAIPSIFGLILYLRQAD